MIKLFLSWSSRLFIYFVSVSSADAVNNAAGYGFQGLDERGKPSWDLVSNLNIVGIEVAIRSIKSSV